MEYPDSVQIDNPSMPDHEHSIFSSEDRPKSDEAPLLIKQPPLSEATTLNNETLLLETPISTNSTCAPDFAIHAVVPRNLHSLSEIGTWYDEALFSPATTVRNVNTSNIDWYGGNMDRDSISDEHPLYCNIPQLSASAVMPPHPGVCLSGESSIELLPEEPYSIYYPDNSNQINWFDHIQNDQSSDAFTSFAINNTAPVLELSSTIVPLNSTDLSPQLAINTPRSILHTTLFPSIIPDTNEYAPDNLPQNMHQILDFYHDLTEESITWLNTCVPDVFYRKVFDDVCGPFEVQNK